MPTVTPGFPIPIPVDGVHTETHPRDLPATALRDSQNWVLRDGVFRTRAGLAALANNVASRPMGFAEYVHNDGTRRLVMATVAGWRRFNTGTSVWDSITGSALSGSPTDQNVFRVFDRAGTRYLLGVNGANTMKKWDGVAGTYSDVAGSPPRARCMVIANDRIVLFHLLSGATISGAAYDVSANKDFDNGWGTTLTGILADTPGDIISALEFGPLQSAIYKTDAIHMMYSQGDAIAPFRFELKSAAIAGPVSPLAAVQVTDGLHAFLGLDGAIRMFDGVETRSVGYNVQKYIADRMDPSTASRSFGFYDRELGELYFFFPEFGNTDANAFVVVNPFTGVLWPQRLTAGVRASAGLKVTLTSSLTYGEVTGSYGDYSKTYGEFDTPARKIIVAEAGGQVYTHEGATDAGSTVQSYFETGLTELSAPENYKTLVELEHLVEPTSTTRNLTLQIGTATSREERVFVNPSTTIPVGGAVPYRTGHRVTSRLFSYRLSTLVPERVTWGGAYGHVAARGPR